MNSRSIGVRELMNCRALAFASLMILSPACLADDKEVDELLSKMRKAYRSAKTAKLVVETKVDSQDKFRAQTKVSFKSPNKIHARTTGLPGGVEITMVSDGRRMIVSGPGGNQNLDFSMQNALRNLVGNLETICFWDWQRQLSNESGGNMQQSDLSITKEKWEGKEWIVLDEDAPSVGLFVRYYVDPQSFLIWRTIQMTQEGKPSKRKVIQDFVVKSLEIDPEIDESIFKP